MSTAHNVSAAFSRAMDLHRRGDQPEAERAYREIVEFDPQHADAWHLLGFLAFQTGRFELADRCLAQAIALRPDQGEYHNNLALTRFARRQVDSANRHAEEAWRRGYVDPVGYLHLGFALCGQGDLDTAEACLRLAGRIDPQSADVHNYLGVVFKARGNYEEAVDCYQRALGLCPDHVAAFNNLGNAWRDQGDVEAAVPYYEQALRLDPRFVAAHNNLGLALEHAGDIEQAISCYQRACQIDPNSSEAQNNLGNALREQGHHERAAESFQRALETDPTSAEIRNNLGVVLRCQGKLAEAISSFRQSLAQQPDSVNTLVNLASALVDEGKFEEAALRYQQIATARPEQPLWKLRIASICPTVFPSRKAMGHYWEELRRSMMELANTSYPIDGEEFLTVAPQVPFNIQFFDKNLRDIKQSYANLFHPRLAKQVAREVRPLAPRSLRGQRPHVGVVVSDKHEGVFLKSMRGVLERLDTDQFCVSVFCGQSGWSQLSRSLPGHKIRVVALPKRFFPAAQMLRDQQCHLLYYWEVGTDATNYFLPFLRLAPVQCTSWGIQVTTGIPEMDCYLSSDLVEPEDGRAHYTENLIRARTLLCYRYRALLDRPRVTREAWGCSSRDHLYVCAHQMGKFHPDFDATLAEILRRDRAGKVLAIEDRFGQHAQFLRARFATTMPDVADRIVFLPRLERQEYLSLIAAADVLLDPPYFGGVNTTYDSLSLNRPVVTLPSTYHRGRYTLGCYNKIGVHACVADTTEQYIQIAVRIASDPDCRHEVTRQLEQASGDLFEDVQAVGEHERIFAELIESAST